ncbi:MAG: hypothetical protein ACI936_000742 [Paraglaciecola sp.]|jgi:hypothetical protein
MGDDFKLTSREYIVLKSTCLDCYIGLWPARWSLLVIIKLADFRIAKHAQSTPSPTLEAKLYKGYLQGNR